MVNLDDVYTIAINFVQIFLQFLILTTLFKVKVSWLITLLASTAIAVLQFGNPWMMLGIFFVSTAIYYCLIASMRKKQAVLAISMQLFLSLYIGNIFSIIFRVLAPELNNHFTMIAVIVAYIVIFILIKQTKFTTINLTRSKIMFVLSITLLLVGLSSIASVHFLFFAEVVTNAVVFNALAVLVMQTTIIYMTFVLNKFASEVESAELQKQYTETLEKSLVAWEGDRHGYRTLVNTLYGYCEAEDSKGLFSHIRNIVTELNNEKTVIKINTGIKENMPYIYGIVLSNAAFAAQNGIDFSVIVTAKIFELKTIYEMQLSRIVGNLLNNAMEHAYLSAEKCVTMEICNENKKIRIIINNSVDERADTTKILDKGVSGKKGHSGFGLFEVQTIVNNRREEGWYVDFTISCTDDTFTADLLV
ncbi:MAG: GHKL domain-containing protein [Defluviitaleaceae bacterium]|nr:GHKL domain-containing protein [Defluviitaleaceae bacterium]